MKLKINVEKSPTAFIIYCPYFPGVNVDGKTLEDAILNFKDLLTFAFDHKKQRGILADFLEENKWHKKGNKWFPPYKLTNEQKRLIRCVGETYSITEIDFDYPELL